MSEQKSDLASKEWRKRRFEELLCELMWFKDENGKLYQMPQLVELMQIYQAAEDAND